MIDSTAFATARQRLFEFGLHPDNYDDVDETMAKAQSFDIQPAAYVAAFGNAYASFGQPVYVVDRDHRPLAVFWEEVQEDILDWEPLRTDCPLFAGFAVYNDTGERATLRPREDYTTEELQRIAPAKAFWLSELGIDISEVS